ncbi:hypothetical protein AAAC51_00345 [Priestia megaterium]
MRSQESLQSIIQNFNEVEKGLSNREAVEESNRCLYCYDAPCIQACPTGIDIPTFIKKIASGNLKGSAETIMSSNPVGASCSRVCPTDELCEGACVLNHSTKPIMIEICSATQRIGLFKMNRCCLRKEKQTAKR